MRKILAKKLSHKKRMKRRQEKILVVDDEPKICELLSEILEEEGYRVLTAENGEQAMSLVSQNDLNLIVLDFKLPDMDGLAFLKVIKDLKPALPVVMISAYGTIKTAVEAVKNGAYDFIEKPLEQNRILLTIKNALDKERLEREIAILRADALKRYKMIGTSATMQKVYSLIDKAAPTDASVLILGESGVGKELVARAIHNRSKRTNEPFVKINCAAIPQELIESELFGHEKGAFTDATALKKGKFEIADEGTLLLDEIGDMSLPTQAKLLRFLQDGEFQRLGGTKTIKINVRIIAASNKNLKEEIKKKTFRDDLYYRLNVINIHIPPLREREEDVPVLADHFLAEFSEQYGLPKKQLQPSALDLLSSKPWPGNVRELKHVIERIVVLVKSQSVSAQDLTSALQEENRRELFKREISLNEAKENFEREYIFKTLIQNNWHMRKTAESLGIERTNLYRKLKKLGIHPST